MSGAVRCSFFGFLLLAAWSPARGAGPTVNDSPAAPGEWGFHPRSGASLQRTPPPFCWRPQEDAASYTVQASRDPSFRKVDYEAQGISLNVHCPPRDFPPGQWAWRFRYATRGGATSSWSRTRRFEIRPGAASLPLPPRKDLLARIPKEHPRLFVRPEQLPELRRLAQGKLKPLYQELVRQCEQLVKSPPPASEPPKYPPGMERKSEGWREIWWGNRVYTIRVLNSAATLGFVYLLDGNEQYGQLARRLLLEAADWDPHGATGYRYNDEAGMPYAYYFSRTYTFVYPLLSEAEREKCRAVMKVRGQEMYEHLCPRHLWRPYASHSNRAWHFLGEIAVAFQGEIEGSDDWAWFAMNVFANVYPVWCDSDGGWHEGLSYWNSYIHRFTWWADVMRAAFRIDAYRNPYFARAGYFPLYVQPPGTRAGGFGDLAFDRDWASNKSLMRILAAQAGNPYWEWYAEAGGKPAPEPGYIGFVRGALPRVKPKPPSDLPASRVFRGVGLAALNTNLLDGSRNVSVLFKSSPFGSQSHGFESQNAFQLYAFGQPLLIRTGRRDIYGSKHHAQWMWSTRSVNSVLVNNQGQIPHSSAAIGRILRFHASPAIDFVEGEAGQAYGGKLDRFTRDILFVKPDLVVIYDRLAARKPSTFQWLLHAPTEMRIEDQHDITVVNRGAACRVDLLWPPELQLKQTDQFDPPPRPRVRLRQFHLTAAASKPAPVREFVAAIRPYREGSAEPGRVRLSQTAGGYEIRAQRAQGEAVILLKAQGQSAVGSDVMQTKADAAVVLMDSEGKILQRFSSEELQPLTPQEQKEE